MNIRVGHLYPDYLNIYADRGNIAVLTRRAAWRGHEREVTAIGTYLHGPLLPRNPRLADWVLAQALAHRTGGDAPELAPLDDELEEQAHAVSSARARRR